MIIANKLLKENVIEYLVYMFQIEDTIRLHNLDSQQIKEKIVDQYKTNDTEKIKIEEWYIELVHQMKFEGIQKAGHLKSLKDIIDQLFKLHKQIIEEKDTKYLELLSWAIPSLEVLQKKSKGETNDVEMMINSVYMVLLMRLQKKEVSSETIESISVISNLLGYLANKYHSKS
jgi:hypothetical protein